MRNRMMKASPTAVLSSFFSSSPLLSSSSSSSASAVSRPQVLMIVITASVVVLFVLFQLTFSASSSTVVADDHHPHDTNDANHHHHQPPPRPVSQQHHHQHPEDFETHHCADGMLRYSRKFASHSGSAGGWVAPGAKFSRLGESSSLVGKVNTIQELAKFLQNKQDPRTQRLMKETDFAALFEIEYEEGRLHLPAAIRTQAIAMFSAYPYRDPNDPEDVKHVERQHVVTAINRVTADESLFNELRKYRPGAVRSISQAEDEQIDAKYLEKEGRGKCDFCDMHKTAEDVFGRVVGKHCFTCANIAKVCNWHGLLLNRRHHPLRVEIDEVRDWFVTARKWFAKAHAQDATAVYPHIMYDAGSRASASQPHLHLQMMLTRHQYFTHAKQQVDAAKHYAFCAAKGERDYWTEWIRAHEAVGLALPHPDGAAAWLLVPLTPVHDKEIYVVGDSASRAFADLYYCAITTLVKSKLQVRSFSTGTFLEAMNSDESSIKMPAVARFMDRGSPFDVRSDVGAMEFYGAFNVATDPFTVMAEVRKVWATMPFVKN